MVAGVTKEKTPPSFTREQRERIQNEIKNLERFERILEFAIGEEKKACDFYARVAKRMKHPWTRKAFERLAREELKQRKRLLRMKRAGYVPSVLEKVPDPKITEYVTAEVLLRDNLDAREALAIAIKAKEASQRFYLDLAAKTANPNLRVVFRSLAVEDAIQKLKIETESDARASTLD